VVHRSFRWKIWHTPKNWLVSEMNTSLIAVLALLIAMVALIVRPFITANAASPSIQPTPIPAESFDVRGQVEAAIAARKAALTTTSQAVNCSGCGSDVEPLDVFCRTCGNKLN
jgi:hypothetical protein